MALRLGERTLSELFPLPWVLQNIKLPLPLLPRLQVGLPLPMPGLLRPAHGSAETCPWLCRDLPPALPPPPHPAPPAGRCKRWAR